MFSCRVAGFLLLSSPKLPWGQGRWYESFFRVCGCYMKSLLRSLYYNLAEPGLLAARALRELRRNLHGHIYGPLHGQILGFQDGLLGLGALRDDAADAGCGKPVDVAHLE